ncbi:MAG: response regulator [Proteobacteria bacterium]|nr:response regulator [Pseudomonadota bacterium]
MARGTLQAMDSSTHLERLLTLLDRPLRPDLDDRTRWSARLGVLIAVVIALLLLAVSPLFAYAVGLPLIGVSCIVTGALFLVLARSWGTLGHHVALPVLLGLCFALETVALLTHGGAESPFIAFVIFPVLYAALLGTRRLGMLTAAFAIVYSTAFSLIPASVDVGQPPEAQLFWLVSITPMVLLGGTIVGVMAELRAEAAEKALQAQADAEAAQVLAEQASHAKSDFLAVASHEMRSPLAGILGASELLLRETNDPESVTHWASVIAESGRRMAALVDDLLDFKRIELGEVRLKDEPFSPAALITEVVALLRETPKGQASTVRVTLGADLARGVRGDADRVRQVLINLIGNALKFSDGEEVTVVASESLTIDVCDKGPGVDPQIRATLFQPFVRGDSGPDRNSGGTGLGLAISQRLAHAMDGELHLLDSEVGAHFRLELDLESADVPELEPSLNGANRPLSVLVVDDEPLTRDIAVRMLEHSGHAPLQANSGAAALAACAIALPDLVLLDWHMPGLDGFQTATQLLEAYPDLQVVGFTASTAPEEHERAAESGMTTVLQKPMSLKSLRAILADAS